MHLEFSDPKAVLFLYSVLCHPHKIWEVLLAVAGKALPTHGALGAGRRFALWSDEGMRDGSETQAITLRQACTRNINRYGDGSHFWGCWPTRDPGL